MRLFLKILGGVLLLLVIVVGVTVLSLRAQLPETTVELTVHASGQAPDDDSSILIFGATRNTGLLVAQLLHDRGDRVTAVVRPSSDRSALQKLGVEIVTGDALDFDGVRSIMQNGDYRAVLTTVGCLSCDPPPDYIGNANIIEAARETGIRRLVLVTTIGAGDSYDAVPWLSRRVLAKTLPMKEQAEEDLRASGLDYTIVRPGGLRSGHRTGHGVLTEDRDAFGYIFRQDLAELLVAVLDDPRAIGRTFAAIDSQRVWIWSNE